MAAALPPELLGLLNATDRVARDAAWDAFVAAHSRLLMYVARSVGREYDAAMDAYVYLLEQLRADDCRRLHAYADDGRSKFTTWLVVVARRLCLDQVRRRYGRARGEDPAEGERRAERRRLEDLLSDRLDLDSVVDVAAPEPDAELIAAEQSRALLTAVAGLEPRDRLLLKLRFEDDLSAREIAPLLAFPTPFHVYRRINAVLQSLRAALAPGRSQQSAVRPFNRTGEE
jgi:RNA polymerase sigma factor (sigma-70 family)